MRFVKVRANGGISIISAFIDGMGGAFSIDLPITVTVSEGKCGNETKVVEDLKRLLNIPGCYHAKVSSSIPSGYGLKSSSAFILALAKAIALFSGREIDDLMILDVSAKVSKENGMSVTGALDDLCQAMYGGYCLTDNRKMRILRRGRLPEFSVLVCADGDKRLSGNVSVKGKFEASMRKIEDLAFSGHVFEASVMNGLLYGSIFGMNTGLIGKILSNGALYSSQSGKGPAIFGIFSKKDLAMQARSHVGFGIITKISNEGIRYWTYDS